MKLLITGYNGFAGSNLCASLPDHELSGIDITESSLVAHHCSWDDLNNVPPADVIIHLAGKAHDIKNQSISEEYFDINTGLTQKIFDYFLQSEAGKFICFSSVKAAADKVEGDWLTEAVVPKPKGPYGESKIKAEEYILSKQAEYEAKGKKVYIIRPCMIHGPGNKGNLNLLYNLGRKGIPWPLGAFDNKRSFCSVDNIVFVVEQLIQRNDIPAGIYNVADDETLSTNEIIRLINQSANKQPCIWKLPKGLINAIAEVGTALHLPLTKERLNKLTENYIVSNTKIKNALGIERMPVSAHDGMIKTFKSF